MPQKLVATNQALNPRKLDRKESSAHEREVRAEMNNWEAEDTCERETERNEVFVSEKRK
jgi:hypothetical protein